MSRTFVEAIFPGVMFRRKATRIGLIAGALLLAAQPASTQQSAGAPQTQIPANTLTMRLSPGKWVYGVTDEVRSIETTEFRVEIKNGREVETRLGSKTSYFDRRGFETELVEDEEAKTFWKYDSEGKVAEMVMTLAGVVLMREVYSYDFGRRKITTEIYELGSDRPRSRQVAFFDERWNQTRWETEYFESAGGASPRKEVVVYTQKYDSKGRVIFSTVGAEDGSISDSETEEYSDSNYPVRGVYYSYDRESGQLRSKSVNTYDARGHLVENLHYNARGQLVRRTTYQREYDARGNWITERESIWDNDGGWPPTSFTLIKRRRITFY